MLGIYMHGRMESSSDKDYMWVLKEGVERKCTVIYMAVASIVMVNLMVEKEEKVEGEEEERGKEECKG